MEHGKGKKIIWSSRYQYRFHISNWSDELKNDGWDIHAVDLYKSPEEGNISDRKTKFDWRGKWAQACMESSCGIILESIDYEESKWCRAERDLLRAEEKKGRLRLLTLQEEDLQNLDETLDKIRDFLEGSSSQSRAVHRSLRCCAMNVSVGDAVHVFSKSANVWMEAEVVVVMQDGSRVIVEYDRGDGVVRAMGVDSDELIKPPTKSLQEHCCSQTMTEKPPRYLAVLVGHQETRFQTDVIKLSETLRSVGYTILCTLPGATADEVLQAARKLCEEANHNDVAIFYTSGHGERHAGNGLKLRYGPHEVVDAADLTHALHKLRSSKAVIYIHCCYAGRYFAVKQNKSDTEDDLVAKLSRQSGKVTIVAGPPNDVTFGNVFPEAVRHAYLEAHKAGKELRVFDLVSRVTCFVEDQLKDKVQDVQVNTNGSSNFNLLPLSPLDEASEPCGEQVSEARVATLTDEILIKVSGIEQVRGVKEKIANKMGWASNQTMLLLDGVHLHNDWSLFECGLSHKNRSFQAVQVEAVQVEESRDEESRDFADLTQDSVDCETLVNPLAFESMLSHSFV